MSLHDDPLQGQRSTPPSINSNGGLPRSKSFTGVPSHKRTGSSASAEGHCQESEVGAWTTWGPAASGHSRSSPKLFRRPLSFPGQSKAQKNLKPGRALVMFEKVAKGLRECVIVTEEDIANLKHTTEELSIHSQQQLKAAERYMKRLDYQLSKLEELHDQYNIQLKLKDGMRNMVDAYASSSGKERDAALNSVKASYRESTETMYRIESRLEKMMGTLHFQMKGIQGFARLCSGDVFEITIKHSSQKWKSRGRVQKNGQQAWDSPHATFKALLGEYLFIKAVEVKGLGKTVLLGNKYCETRDLFSAHPQIMTINLNPSGSLKLNVVITWNPLDGNIDEVMRNHTAPNQVLPHRHLSNVSTNSNFEKSASFLKIQGFGAGNLHKFLSQDSLSRELRTSNSMIDPNKCHANVCALENSARFSQSLEGFQERQPLPQGNTSDSCSIDLAAGEREILLEKISVDEALRNLSCSLEDIQGQYPELHALELLVTELEQTLGKQSRRGSQSSEFSTSIESVLECFDFLNTETDDDEDLEWIQNKIAESEKLIDPGSTAKTSDSGIGSLTHASPKQTVGSGSSPLSKNNSPILTSENQVDFALVIHLAHCQTLVQSLGTFGPLKCKEVYALEKLRKQIPILDRLILLFKSLVQADQEKIMGIDELKDALLQQIWARCAEHRHQLCIPASVMAKKLEEICIQRIDQSPAGLASAVAQLLTSRIVDMNHFDPGAIVTVFMFKIHFQQENQLEFDLYLESLAREVQLIKMLQSHDVPVILEAVNRMSQSLSSSNCLQTISQLLLVPHENIQGAVKKYFKDLMKLPFYQKVITIFVEALESESSLTRQGACLALLNLKATEYINELAYICQTDECSNVCATAKEALLSFGTEGLQAYEQIQLSGMGFQRFGVK